MRKSCFGMLFISVVLIISCNHTLTEHQELLEPDNTEIDDESIVSETESVTPTNESIEIFSDNYFWGTWISSNTGIPFIIYEASAGGNPFSLSDSNKLIVENVGTFVRDTENTMKCDSEIYYRKGARNIPYSFHILFEDGNVSYSKCTVKAFSQNYSSYMIETRPNSDGLVELYASLKDEPQIIKVFVDDKECVSISNIKISECNVDIGNVLIPKSGNPSFKATKSIYYSNADYGYMFASNYKKYTLSVSIENISSIESGVTVCSFSPRSSGLKISSSNLSSSDDVLVSSLSSHETKQIINISVEYESIVEDYIDTGIDVVITDVDNNRTVCDFIPLRFYKGLVPITVSQKSTGGILKGVLTTSCAETLFFIVNTNETKTVFIPTFGENNTNYISFGNENDDGILYSVYIGSRYGIGVVVSTDDPIFSSSINYAEPNDSISASCLVENPFQAYLGKKDKDFYSFAIQNDARIELPDGTPYYYIYFKSEYSTPPEPRSFIQGYELSEADLPRINDTEYYEFVGYNMPASSNGKPLYSDLVLSAVWKPIYYNVIAYDGDNQIEFSLIPVKSGYNFEGWYKNKDFTGDVITEIPLGHGEMTLYSKWNSVYTAGTISKLNFNTSLNDPNDYSGYTLYITGEISEDTLDVLFEKIKKLKKSTLNACGITLDLSNAYGIKVWKSNSDWINAGEKTVNRLLLPKGLVEIADYAFYDKYKTDFGGHVYWKKLQTVVIPDSVIYIGNSAFRDCPINSIVLPNRIEEIGEYAFFGGEFEQINFPTNITKIGEYAFAECGIKTLVIPGYIRKVPNKCFIWCNINTLIIQEGVEEIGSCCFACNNNLTSIELPASLTTIGNNAFQHDTDNVNLISVTIPRNVKRIGCHSFAWCKSLNNVFFEDPMNWKRTENPDYIDGETIVLSDPVKNAEYLKDTSNTRYYFYKE